MGYFPVRYNPSVVIYERKMFIRLATALTLINFHFWEFNSRLLEDVQPVPVMWTTHEKVERKRTTCLSIIVY